MGSEWALSTEAAIRAYRRFLTADPSSCPSAISPKSPPNAEDSLGRLFPHELG